MGYMTTQQVETVAAKVVTAIATVGTAVVTVATALMMVSTAVLNVTMAVGLRPKGKMPYKARKFQQTTKCQSQRKSKSKSGCHGRYSGSTRSETSLRAQDLLRQFNAKVKTAVAMVAAAVAIVATAVATDAMAFPVVPDAFSVRQVILF